VVLAAGAIGSPHLLQLSGIGAGDELRAAGVELRHELPGVGKHLEDHLLMAVVHDVPGTGVHLLTRARLALWAAQHLLRRRGPLATGPVDAGGFVKLSPAATVPDLQFHFVPWGVALPTDDALAMRFGRHASLLPSMIYPRSAGEVRLRSADPTQPPVIDPRYFSDPADLEVLVAGVKLSREIAATAPLAGVLGKELFPGPDVRTDDALRDAIRAHCNTIFHPTGTCKMGGDALAVVDPELRVRGLRGLRVADASIMPRIIGGNTNAPVIMIAEKAADLLA
jgi:choline dehydrogenase